VGDLVETAEAHGIERAAWIGHSLGGRLVHELASAEPHRAERLVLLDAPIALRDPGWLLERAEELRREDASWASVEDAIADWRSQVRLAPDELVEESVRDSIEQRPDGRWSYRYSRVALLGVLGDLAREPARPAAVPTLLVLAEESAIARGEDAERLRAQLGDLFRLATVPGGHQVLLDALPETGEAVAAFLGSGVATAVR
jgi:pimeloyl-ACP methyl ester carboxylesterase